MKDKIIKAILENEDKYVIFYSNWCGYSMNAIELLKDNKLPFNGYNIDKIGMSNLLNSLIKNKVKVEFNEEHKTRPIIFKYGKFLGGYTELYNSLNK